MTKDEAIEVMREALTVAYDTIVDACLSTANDYDVQLDTINRAFAATAHIAAPTSEAVPDALRKWAVLKEDETTPWDIGYEAARRWVAIQLSAQPAVELAPLPATPGTIDSDEFQALLREYRTTSFFQGDAMEVLIAHIDARLNAPAGQRDAAGGGWISVDDERKPEPGVPVLLFVRTIQYGESDEGHLTSQQGEEIAMGELRKSEHGDCIECYTSPMSDNDWITHWMPLPPAPEVSASQVPRAGGNTNNDTEKK